MFDHWVQIGSIVTIVIAVIGLVVAAQRYNEGKRSRIYERLDECKGQMMEDLKNDYARKDICALTHSQIEKRLEKIEVQTALLPNIAAQLKILVNGQAK